MLNNNSRAINVAFCDSQRKNYNFLMESLKGLCRELIVSDDTGHEHKKNP